MIRSDFKINIKSKCQEAEKRIREFIRYTPLEFSFYLSKKTQSEVFLKLENIQITRSFKIRGVMNKILSLSEAQRKKGLLTASSGNHGAAVSYVSKKLGIKAALFLPSYVPKTKIESLKIYDPEIEIIGAQPENSPVMYESLKAGKILEMESKPTLSDGTAGGIEQGSITYDLCRDYVDRFVILSEHEIKQAIKLVIEKEHFLLEGAAALSVAALIKEKENFIHKKVVLIISGSKLSLEKLKQIIME
ncbi:MAG TPA: pyridoxal-phosphate dependent enzyme [Acidobacteriota bacterium]|nr:pyridoxal-phosphate dependent enzyme [Acidobacteriota bacterium]